MSPDPPPTGASVATSTEAAWPAATLKWPGIDQPADEEPTPRRPLGPMVMRAVDATPVWVWTGLLTGVLLLWSLFRYGVVGMTGPDGSTAQAPAHALLQRAATELSWVMGSGRSLGPVTLGLLAAGLAVAATMAWGRAVPGPPAVKAISGLVLGLVVADSATAPHLTSAGSGGVVLLALVALMAAWVAPRQPIRWIAAAGVVLAASSAGMAVVAPVVALAVAMRWIGEEGRVRRWGLRAGVIVAALAVVWSAAMTLDVAPLSDSGHPDAAAHAADVLANPGQLAADHVDAAAHTVAFGDATQMRTRVDTGAPDGCRMCVVSPVVSHVGGLAWLVMPAFWWLALRLGSQLGRRARQAGDQHRAALGELTALLAAIAAAHYVFTLVTGPAEDPARFAPAALMTALVVPTLVPVGWSLYVLGVQLRLPPGVLRRLGGVAARYLTAPAESLLPAADEPFWAPDIVVPIRVPAPDVVPVVPSLGLAPHLLVRRGTDRPVVPASSMSMDLTALDHGRAKTGAPQRRRRRRSQPVCQRGPIRGPTVRSRAPPCRAPPGWSVQLRSRSPPCAHTATTRTAELADAWGPMRPQRARPP